MMNSKKVHRLAGIIMLVPLILWALTGVIFLVKPGYEAAYEKLPVRLYAMDGSMTITPDAGWQEISIKRSILGYHLIVQEDGHWQQLDLETLGERPLPSKQQLLALVNDAITANPERYGSIVTVEGDRLFTDTGVEISVDWPRLALQQTGTDTRMIRTLYKIHYLQWLGDSWLNKVLGVLGLAALFVVTLFGLLAYVNGNKYRNTQ
ncbi:PepSY domain-containing protein [Kistimonas scapharcae]